MAKVIIMVGAPPKPKAKVVKDNHKVSARAKASEEATADIPSKIKIVDGVPKAVVVEADKTDSKVREVAVVNPRQLNSLNIRKEGGRSDLYILLSFPIISR